MFPRPIVSLSQFLRGYEDWFVDMAMNLQFMEALMDKILEIDLNPTSWSVESKWPKFAHS
jgi:hypothetical protein